MKLITRTGGALACALAITASAQNKPAAPSVPHLEKRGLATQLIVDGKPFLVLGAEPPTSGASNPEYLRYMYSVMAATHQNTGAMAVGWNWIEREQGKFDFRIVDAIIEDAKESGLRVALLWFGSWKNGQSNFAPPWVKADQDRFPRAQIKDGQSAENLSTFSQNNWEADARAFAAVMRHIREVDKSHRVILVQVENEIGIFGDSRDRSAAGQPGLCGARPGRVDGLPPEAQGGFASGVPQSLGSGRFQNLRDMGGGFRQGRAGGRNFHGLELCALCQSRRGGRQEGIPGPDVREYLGQQRLGDGSAWRADRPCA